MPYWKVRGKGWRYQFRFQGRRYSGQWFRTKAEAVAAAVERRKELLAKARENPAPSPTPSTFFQLATAYLEDAQRRFAAKTWKYKRYVYRCFLAHYGDMPLERLTTSLVEGYLRTRHSNTNYNRHRKDLHALFNWAVKRRLMKENPCTYVSVLPEQDYRRPLPTPEELVRVFEAAGEERPFLEALYFTAARVDEILRLKWADVDFERKQVSLWTRKRRDGSWRRNEIPLHPVLGKTLKRLWEQRVQDEYVFINPKTGTRYMSRPKLMRGLCRRAGVRPFGFHALRHFAASFLNEVMRVPLKQLQELLRHQNQRTTERYLQSVDQYSRLALEKLPSPEKLLNALTAGTHSPVQVNGMGGQPLEIIGGDEGI